MLAIDIRTRKRIIGLESKSCTVESTQIFPLPLAPFEAYMLADHRDDYPMHFYFRMKLQGRLRSESFRQAVTESIERHPLLRAKVLPRFGRAPVWQPSDVVCIRTCQEGFTDLTEVLQPPHIDLTSESGLRTWVFDGRSDTELLFEFHHSCCDGLGALIFLEDLLVTYHRITAGEQATDVSVRGQGLKTRAAIPLTAGQAVRKIPFDIVDFFRIVLRRPATAAQPETPVEPEGSRRLSAFLSHQFSTDELNALLAEARVQSSTLNNILMKDVYRSLDQCLEESGESAHRWIRMGVPASTRVGDSANKTCCNHVTIMFLDQHSSDIRTSESLLHQITQMTRFHRESNIWYSMLQLLEVLAAVPPLLRLYLRTNRRMCTTITSNVGRAFESCPLPRNQGQLVVGDMLLTSLSFLSPLRPGTEVTFGCVTYGNTLSLSMHYKPQRVGKDQARKLMDHVVGNLRKSAGAGFSERPEES
jgi:NRPS condensation-like uncharacterized protein